MSEIEKLYELAGANKILPPICSDNEKFCANCPEHIKDAMPYCKSASYPPFTAEKQLELIKWLIKKYKIIRIQHNLNLYYIHIRDIYTGKVHIELDEAIAGLINNLWQDLTETEQEEIREILKG